MTKLLAIVLLASSLQAATHYISQGGGTFTGGTVCNGQTAESIATFNGATPAAGDINYLCGTITTGPVLNASGGSGNVISLIWDTGARISLTHGQMINVNGAIGFWLFDGGIACGPATACDAVEAANPTGYASGQAGIIEATANGSSLANQDINTQAFYGCNGCHDIEIRNIIIRNLYVHSLLTDTTSSADSGAFIFQCSGSNTGCASGIISIHDSVVHDNGNAISIQKVSTTTINTFNIDFYHNNWAMENSGNGVRTLNFHDNHIHDTTNWDTNADTYHHNALHNYMVTASDSTAINFYNNLSDGDWGTCCTTDTSLFVEISLPNNFNVFNNVCIQFNGNVAPCWGYFATTGVFANNTALGATVMGNVKAIEVGGTNITFENNTVDGYGQFVVVDGGSTFTVWDYNIWGLDNYDGNDPWSWQGTGAGNFPAWQSACSCDSHGSNPGTINVNASAIPNSGSPLISAGVNLSGLSITALNSTSSGGSTMATVARGGGSWTVGSYNFPSSTFTNNYLHGSSSLSGPGSIK